MDLNTAFAVPHSWLAQNKENLNATQRTDGSISWHIPLTTLGGGILAINLTKIGKKYELGSHQFLLKDGG